MSVGKKFTRPKEDLTEIQRIEELESLIPALVERIQQYDKVLDGFKDQEKLVSAQDFSVKELSASVDVLSEKMKAFKLALDSCLSRFDSTRNKLEDSLDIFSGKIELFQDQMADQSENVSEVLNEMGSRLYEILKAYVKLDDLNPYTESFSRQIDQLQNKNDFLVSNSKYLSESLNELNAWKNENQQVKESTQLNLSNLQKFLSASKKDQELGLKNIYSVIEDQKATLEKFIIKNMEDVKSYIDSNPASLEYIRKEFDNKLELIKLDSENSSQKSTNNDKQIKILEKKIENVLLKVRSLEISQ